MRNEAVLIILPGAAILSVAAGDRHMRRVRLSLGVDLPISGQGLAVRLREMREHAGLNQRELAEACDTTIKSISSVEMNTQGRTDTMSFMLLFRIAEACGFDVAQVIAPRWVPPSPIRETRHGGRHTPIGGEAG